MLAFLHAEPGGDSVAHALEGGRISAVNCSEVLHKSLHRNVNTEGMQQEFIEVGVSFEPFTSQPAETAAHLWPQARNRGLSLVDRACLALDKALPVLTADRAWSELGLDIEIQVVR